MKGENLSSIAGKLQESTPTSADVVEMAGDLLAIACLAQNIPADFDGCEITFLCEQGSHRLKALILSPVDMQGDEPFSRYSVHPDHVIAPKAPKLVLSN